MGTGCQDIISPNDVPRTLKVRGTFSPLRFAFLHEPQEMIVRSWVSFRRSQKLNPVYSDYPHMSNLLHINILTELFWQGMNL